MPEMAMPDLEKSTPAATRVYVVALDVVARDFKVRRKSKLPQKK